MFTGINNFSATFSCCVPPRHCHTPGPALQLKRPTTAPGLSLPGYIHIDPRLIVVT